MKTYHAADHNLAILWSRSRGALGTFASSSLGGLILLHAASSSGSLVTARTTTASVLTAADDDVIERLVQVDGHCD